MGLILAIAVFLAEGCEGRSCIPDTTACQLAAVLQPVTSYYCVFLARRAVVH